MFNIKTFFLLKSRGGRAFLAVFVLLFLGFLILLITAPKPKDFKIVIAGQEYTDKEKAKERLVQELEKDSDNDGLKDWEEQIYKTDINNPDTDGDGTSDGAEIKQNRNPLVRGPNDKVFPIQTENSPLTFQYNEQNITHLFTQQVSENPIFGKMLSGEKNKIPANTIETYIRNLPVNSLVQSSAPQDPKTLTIIENASATALYAYFEGFARAYMTHGDDLVPNEFIITQQALENTKPDALKRLTVYANALEAIARDADTLAIPRAVLWFHVKEVSLLTQSADEARALQKITTDPLGGYIVIQKRIKTRESISDNHTRLLEWLTEQKIEPSPAIQLFFGL